jgi:hypothetical protein
LKGEKKYIWMVEMMDKTGNQRGWTGKDSNLLSMA